MPRIRVATPQIITTQHFREREFGPRPWVWYGYLSKGSLALFTSPEKIGKTTLLSVLLSKTGHGGDLAGSAVQSGRVLVVSEEDERIWAHRMEKMNLGSHIGWIIRPFVGPPTLQQWSVLIRRIIREHQRTPFMLVVIDPLANLFPHHAENNPALLLKALAPLRQLAELDAAILLIHHPSKRDSSDQITPRGTGVLAATVDILLSLGLPVDPLPNDRRRWLRARSRYEESTPERLIEWNTAGTDYDILTDVDAGKFVHGWTILKTVLEDANHRLTRHGVLRNWPNDFDRPHPGTLWRWLDRALADGLIARQGTGRKSDPFLYWLPGRELFLLPDLPPLEPMEWGKVLEADRLAEDRLEELAERRRRR